MAEKRTTAVQSVERAISILTTLTESHEGQRLTKIAHRTGLSVSTTHRLLTTLEMQKYVQFDPVESMWYVGRAAFEVGSAFVRQRNFVAAALPYLRHLRDITKETANLGVAADDEIVVLTQVESREVLRTINRVGGSVPIACTAMGKAILANYSRAELHSIISKNGLFKHTTKSIVNENKLHQELDLVRARGYSVDDEEFVSGIRCIAAAVYNDHGDVLCSIGISGLSYRLTREKIPSIGKVLRATSRELTLALGGMLPDEASRELRANA